MATETQQPSVEDTKAAAWRLQNPQRRCEIYRGKTWVQIFSNIDPMPDPGSYIMEAAGRFIKEHLGVNAKDRLLCKGSLTGYILSKEELALLKRRLEFQYPLPAPEKISIATVISNAAAITKSLKASAATLLQRKEKKNEPPKIG